MRRGFGLIGLVVTVILLAIVGVIAYNLGWSDGIGTHLPAASANGAPPYYYYGYGPHAWGLGFGIFGFFWFLFVVFGLFWLFRLAFWGRRGWGGGWGSGYHGHGVPPGIEQRMQEWHRQAHGEQPPAAGTTPPPPPPPSDQRTV